MAELFNDSLEAILQKVKRQVSAEDYEDALVNLRKMGHYMAKWIVFSEGLWDEARTSQDGKIFNSPSFAQCIRILRVKKKINKKERLMFEGIQEYGNEGAHESGSQKNDAIYFCNSMEEYISEFSKRFPNATRLSILPNSGEEKRQNNVNEVFGCDIGNGFGFISVLQNKLYDPVPMFPSKYRLSATGMPAAAYIVPPDGNNIEVFTDRAAIDKYARHSDRIIHAVKTRLKEDKLNIPGIEKGISPYSVYASIARDLIRLGNEERKNRGEKPIYDIVFTFPASFSTNFAMLNKMQRSIESVKTDGKNINVVGRLPEPAAVAIDYLNYMQNIAPENIRIQKDNFTALVYDLGHGTFDTAVVTASTVGMPYKMHFNDGLPEIGGKNFDEVLINEIYRILKENYNYVPVNRDSVRSLASRIKHDLSDNETSEESFLLPDGEFADITITRNRFEELSRYLLMQTFEMVDKMITRAKNEKIQIDAVVLSGGSSLMPMVLKGLSDMLENENIPVRIYRPSEAVSYGASRFGYGRKKQAHSEPSNNSPKPETEPKPEKILEQLTQYSYGIWVPDNGLKGVIKILLGGKTVLGTESEEIKLLSPSSRFELKIFRSISKELNSDTCDVEKCMEIIRIPFEAGKNTEVSISINVLEDYNVRVTCKTESGLTIVKSTADSVEKLV